MARNVPARPFEHARARSARLMVMAFDAQKGRFSWKFASRQQVHLIVAPAPYRALNFHEKRRPRQNDGHEIRPYEQPPKCRDMEYSRINSRNLVVTQRNRVLELEQ